MTLLDLIREKSKKTDGTIVELIKAIECDGATYVIQQEFSLVEPKLEFATIDEILDMDESRADTELAFEIGNNEIEFSRNKTEVELR